MPPGRSTKLGRPRKKLETVYDEQGNYTVFQHQDQLRQLKSSLLGRYYGETQRIAGEGPAGAAAWERALAAFREPLPATVWIDDTNPLAPSVARFLTELASRASGESTGPSGTAAAAAMALVEPIPWYPLRGMAWRIRVDKSVLRRAPELQPLRRFLVQQTQLGTVSRQEEVSMIPPLLLDIQSEDVCLDMCASPGSKTAQMLVALARHKQQKKQQQQGGDNGELGFPFDYLSAGLIVANELDSKRANMLVHQVKRLRLLFPFALFTNHDARFFPDIGSTPETAVRFDKILCDVVCSGDGTLRKAPFIFKVWNTREAHALQKTQIQIALRACHLLKVGGRIVYSTCSLNPIENEAVIAQIVRRTDGAMRLVDGRPLLPQLRCDPGLRTWRVCSPKGDPVDGPSEAYHEALFPPPPPPDDGSSGGVGGCDLRLCMRLLPEHCDGGGFFVAVLDKVAEYRHVPHPQPPASSAAEPGQSAAPEAVAVAGDDDSAAVAVPKRGRAPRSEAATERVAPPQYSPAPVEMVDALRDFYAVRNFPTDHLVVRVARGERELRVSHGSTACLISRSARRVLELKTDRLIVVSAGLRVLAHEDLANGWRIASEAAPLFATLMRNSPRMLCVSVGLVEALVAGGALKDVAIASVGDEALQARLLALPLGTVLLAIDAPAAPGGVVYSVALRARTRLQLLVDREDLVGLMLQLGREPPPASAGKAPADPSRAAAGGNDDNSADDADEEEKAAQEGEEVVR